MNEHDDGIEEDDMDVYEGDDRDGRSEPIEEYDSRRVGGTDDNPIIATLFRFDDSEHASERVVISLGRGRKMITTLTKTGDDIKGVARFENHHRSRGWTLRTEVVLFSKDQKELGRIARQRGLRPKGASGYRRAERSFEFPGAAGKVSYVMVVSFRNPSLRYKEIIDAISGDLIRRLIEWVEKELLGEDKDKPRTA